MLLREGDFVAIKEGRRSRMKAIIDSNQGREVPTWLDKNVDAMKFQLVTAPNVEQIGLSIATNLIVEFYSR
jgi:ribosomal protein S4